MPLSLSSRDFYRSVESITRHMYSDLRVSGSQGGEPRKGEKKEERERERRKKIRTSGGERWPFQCKQLGEHRVRLAAIGQVNDATYAREWSQGARHSRPTTDDRRRRVVAELSLQLRKIATPPVTVVFQPFRTAYLQRHPDNWSGQTEHALETRFSVLLI